LKLSPLVFVTIVRKTILIEDIFCNFNMDDLSLPSQRRDNLYPAGMQGFSSKWKTLYEWIRSSDGKTEIAEAKKDAWVPFNKQFPNADKSKFVSQATIESKGNVSAEIFFKASEG